ncbi:RNA polymerase recycling motor HelD [Bacillus glycinifermentans]|uniref:RNA polymerase recycling motor HelD n=1 Tax=Bacillus glycinifermentans TaxID=1664069 RepID=UPI002DBF0800|nr:RNA polymerase recycling motor HelD [Bacillus glycinifermentans]MEC3607608.1 RNA polymerase recycling motor HelD [Bacillus glycinifermentans]
MTDINKEWLEEEKRIERVLNELDQKLHSLKSKTGGLKEDIVDLRKHFWDDVTVNLADDKEAIETFASIKQQAEMLAERERSHKQFYSQVKKLLKVKESPYFGRVDFLEDGDQKAEAVYIGLSSFMDEKEERFLIYDWRAPISSLFYNYGPGPARYEVPGETVSGTIELKRQFLIRNGRLKAMFNTDMTIGDELLQEVLGQQANVRMKSIVATIQKEQNRIIRNETSRILIVQGAAGSGKTSAALQRAAYLLYRGRGRIESNQMLLFSPNLLFNSYVADVLPELGEENIQQTTFQEYLESNLKEAECETPFDQLEYCLTASESEADKNRMQAIEYKASLAFKSLIDEYVGFLSKGGLLFKNVSFRGKKIVTSAQIHDYFCSLGASGSLLHRIETTAKWLLSVLHKQEKSERKKEWALEKSGLLDQEEYANAYKQLQEERQFAENTFDDYEREQRLLINIIVEREFKPLRQAVKALGFIDFKGTYLQLFSDWGAAAALPDHWERICAHTRKSFRLEQIPYEDAAPYLYLKNQIKGVAKNTAIHHVFIDEAQDYSPFQLAFLKGLFPSSRMTILGDLNQAILPHSVQGQELLSENVFEGEKTETVRLVRSYRSTRDIVEFTMPLIKGGEDIEPFNRRGVKPTLTISDDHGEHHKKIASCIAALQGEGHKTIAVICKTVQECKEAFRHLEKYTALKLIDKETRVFQKEAVIIPVYLAKGIEFDAVIVYDVSKNRYARERERTLFYTACTRAMHELHLFSLGEESPFLDGVPNGLYIEKRE